MSASDIALITNLLGRYCHIVDAQPIDDVRELFWGDATLTVSPDTEPVAGIDDILGWYRDWDRTMRSPVSELRHRITSLAITTDGDRASALSYLDADAIAKGKLIAIRGRYVDELERRDGEWRFSRRHIDGWTSPARTPLPAPAG